jgi:hypothetical protein
MSFKDELVDWKTNHPITKMFYETCDIRVAEATEILVATAGTDAISDNFYRGFIAAFREMRDFQIDEENADTNPA